LSWPFSVSILVRRRRVISKTRHHGITHADQSPDAATRAEDPRHLTPEVNVIGYRLRYRGRPFDGPLREPL